MRQLAAALLILMAFGVTATDAEATSLDVSFTPNRLGSSTAIGFALKIGSARSPSPLTGLSLSLPAGIAYSTSALGLAECDKHRLAENGPSACPVNSRVGSGTAMVAVPFGDRVLDEKVALALFVGKTEGEEVEILYDAIGTTPVIAHLIFPGKLVSGAGGGSLLTSIPPIDTLPESPTASVISLNSKIDPASLLYATNVDGRRTLYHPRGIVLPTSCPRRGFRFSAALRFQDAATTVVHDVVACGHRDES
jgi:hypothetical protein